MSQAQVNVNDLLVIIGDQAVQLRVAQATIERQQARIAELEAEQAVPSMREERELP